MQVGGGAEGEEEQGSQAGSALSMESSSGFDLTCDLSQNEESDT